MVACSAEASSQEAAETAGGWRETAANLAGYIIGAVEELADTVWRRLSAEVGRSQPPHIEAYIGYGNDRRIWVRGRLLADRPAAVPQEDDTWWDNLKATYDRWMSDEIPGAKIDLAYAGRRQRVITDEEGYYAATFDIDGSKPDSSRIIAAYSNANGTATAVHRILLRDPRAEYLVISDVDDTVIHTGRTQLVLSARLTFLNNAKTRTPLPGVARLYQSFLHGSEGDAVNPILYVSNSAWNMFDLLRDFLEINDLPVAPLLLRDVGIEALFIKNTMHKTQTVQRLLERFEDLPVILVGDTGQHDAEVYSEVVSANPDRVRAVYLRDIDPDEESPFDLAADAAIEESKQFGVPFLRVGDSAKIAAHAVEIGLLPADVLPTVEADARLDAVRALLPEAAGTNDRR